MPAPPEVTATFPAESLPMLERYAGWLAGGGVERGLLGPREADRIWPRHLVNCALIEPMVSPVGSVCDLGSGAGLPGIVLAILRPTQPIVLLEPLLRRATFLQEVVDDLGLSQVLVVRARAEDYARDCPGHSTVVARAVAPLAKLVTWAVPLLLPGGELLAQKGANADLELQEAESTLAELQAVDSSILSAGEGGNVTHVVRVVRPHAPHAQQYPHAKRQSQPATEDQ